MIIVFLGAPGAGKGTQAALVAKELGLTHISSGDLFRRAVERGDALGCQVKSYMQRGVLVPDDITTGMVLDELTRHGDGGAILDGFPRSLAQAAGLDSALAREKRGVEWVVYIKVPEDELLHRLAGRWLCRDCQAPYSQSVGQTGGRCQKCGGELYQRPDDAPETVKKRLAVYFKETAPLLDYYEKQGKLIEVNGEGEVHQVKERIVMLSRDEHKGVAISIKNERELRAMRRAGQVVARVLDVLKASVRAGMKTRELNEIAERELRALGAKPSFKGYRGFPASLCVSINDEIVHGIPGERIIKDGDIVSLDFGAVVGGYQGDAAVTLAVGEVGLLGRGLITATEGALSAGISAARAGGHLGDISAAIQGYAESRSFAVIREYTGHGVGREMHEEPLVPNYGQAGSGPELKPGMALALEPMLTTGGWRTRVGGDGWVVSTADGSLAAHFEHTIAITQGQAEILTRL